MISHIKLVGNLIKPWIVPSNNFADCTGIQCQLAKYIATSMNFTFELLHEKNGPGFKINQTNWSGMIGRIFNDVSSI